MQSEQVWIISNGKNKVYHTEPDCVEILGRMVVLVDKDFAQYSLALKQCEMCAKKETGVEEQHLVGV